MLCRMFTFLLGDFQGASLLSAGPPRDHPSLAQNGGLASRPLLGAVGHCDGQGPALPPQIGCLDEELADAWSETCRNGRGPKPGP